MLDLVVQSCVFGDRESFKKLDNSDVDWNQNHIWYAYFSHASVNRIIEMADKYPLINYHAEDDRAFKLAVMYNSLEVIQYLVTNYRPHTVLAADYDNDFGHSINVLVCAIKSGSIPKVKFVLETFPELRDEYTILIDASRYYFNNKDMISYLKTWFPDLLTLDWESNDKNNVTDILNQFDTDYRLFYNRGLIKFTD